jgi:serine/threonine protein kinase
MTDLASETAQSSGPALAEATPAVLEGRYALGDLVGVGASAWVYRAEDLRTGRDVAVKLYPPGVGGTDRVRQRSELALLAQLHHPNLVVLFDAGEESGRAYLVMEFVDGPTLAEQLREGPMQAGEVSRLGAELGYALAYVHSRGITHRDVKPANVLMGGRPMLTDFGIARLVDAARVTQTGYLIGTPAYLAPEQVSGGAVGMPADVYALGLVLVEALTGHREFEGDGHETAFARLSRQPSVPGNLHGLTDLLRAMTALDPADRPSAADVSERLQESAPELDDVPMILPLLSGRTERPEGDSGTKVLPLPPAPVVPAQRAPAGLPLPPGPSGTPVRRRLRQRRVLAAALGLTGLAAAAVGLVSAQTTGAEDPVPVMSAPVDVVPVAPVRPTRPVPAQDSGQLDSTTSGNGDSSSNQSSQDAKRAKEEAKKAKEALKKANEKANSSSSDSGGSSSDSGSSSSE